VQRSTLNRQTSNKGTDMSKADELAARLKQTRHTQADAALEIDCWPAQVYDLYHRIEGWLQPVTEVGLKIRRNPTHVCESSPDGESHDYAIDQLVIEANHHSLMFDPIARFTEDGCGRVEIKVPGAISRCCARLTSMARVTGGCRLSRPARSWMRLR